MEKSRDAFRTISEVAEWLDVPTHVLRFWESRFSQIKPVKRAGGRRYYRPSDMALIGGVKVLLHDQGMTIRSVQKILRKQGIRHVSSFSPAVHDELGQTDVIEHAEVLAVDAKSTPTPAPAARATRDAEPAQVTRDEEIAEDQAEPTPSGSDAEPIPEIEKTESLDETPEEPIPAAGPIFSRAPTPSVHETDPDDDDANYKRPPGVAARLAMAARSDLRAHRDILKAARAKLIALRDKAG